MNKRLSMIWIMAARSNNSRGLTFYSQEYEIKRIMFELQQAKQLCRIVLWEDLSYIIENYQYKFFINGKPIDLPNIIINKTGAGMLPSWIYALETIESLGVKCINSFKVNELITDKLRTLNILSTNGIPVPKSFLLREHYQLNEIVKNYFEFPVVLKPIKGSLGKGIQLCKTLVDLENIFNIAASLGTGRNNLLVQEFIDCKPGQDLRIIMIGKTPIGAMLRTSTDNFKANISAGGVGESYPLTDEILELCGNINKIIDSDIVGIDLLFDKNGFKVCEINSSPGFEGFEKYCDASVAKKIANYIIEQYNK